MMSMTTHLNITESTTTVLTDGRHPYPVVPERLVQIDGVDYVRCERHGLIPLDHHCAKTPHDHWCREAAHPDYDPADGDQGLAWEEEQTHWSLREVVLRDALYRAVLYLDGFVWLQDPEASELDAIKETCVSAFHFDSWEQVMDYARRQDEWRKQIGRG